MQQRISGKISKCMFMAGWLFVTSIVPVQGETVLKVAFGLARPPHITVEPSGGSTWEITSEIFRRMNQLIEAKHVSNKRLEFELKDGHVDVAIEVRPTDKSLFYSAPFIAYRNVVVTKKMKGIMVQDWADLSGLTVCSWQTGATTLGQELADSIVKFGSYREFPDQEKQVQQWLFDGCDALLIDRSIFLDLYDKALETIPANRRTSLDTEYVFAPIPTGADLWWHAGFRDEILRDRFDHHLKQMREDGTYDHIVARHHFSSTRGH